MDFEFKHKEVAEVYETDFTHDPMIRIPKHYMGRLSGITLAAAEAAISQGSNILKPKPKSAKKNVPVQD